MTSRLATQKRKRGRMRPRALPAVAVVVGVLLLGLLVDSALSYNKIHSGVTVSGYSVGGLTREEATVTLRSLTEEAAQKPIILASGTKTWTIMPQEVDIKIDVAGVVSKAFDVTRKSNFVANLFRRFTLYFKDKDVPLSGEVNSRKLDKMLSGVARELDVPPVDPGLLLDGSEIKAVEGHKGRVVDRERLRADVWSLLFSLHATRLEVPMIIKEPLAAAEDSREAVEQATRMMSDSVDLAYGDHSWTLTREQIRAYLDFTTQDRDGVSTLVVFLSPDKMAPFLGDVAEEVDEEAVDATFKGDGQRAWVVPAVDGKEVDLQKTTEALTVAALKPAGRSAQVVLAVTKPEFTTQEAEAMGINEKLGSYSTSWEGTSERQTNVRITTEYANNVVLAPGEVFDFDKQIGPRTEERGYEKAPGITGGELEDQLGGGICQVSTTLFNAVFFAGLQVLERRNHSIYISHYPKGRDATVSAGSPNFRFRNDTEHHILVRGVSDGITTTFVIYGTRTGRKVTYTTSDFYDVVPMETVEYAKSSLGPGVRQIKRAGQEGRSIKVERTVKSQNGDIVHEDAFVSVWRMIPEEIYVGVGESTTTTKTSTSDTTEESKTTTTTAKAAGTTTEATARE